MAKFKNFKKSQEPRSNFLFTYVNIYYLIKMFDSAYPAKPRNLTRRQKMAKNKQTRSQIYSLVILVLKKKNL